MKTPFTFPPSPYQTAENKLRQCFFSPYRPGIGLPSFTLTLWDTNTRDPRGKCRPAYQLRQHLKGKTTVLFEGADYCCAPGHAVDSDSAVEGLMSFLTLRPGDTDGEYFANYTEAQREFCSLYAETLGAEVQARFCDENGRVRNA